MKKFLNNTAAALMLSLGAGLAHGMDAVDHLRDFVREVKTGQAHFTQTVTAPDGTQKKPSSGTFEFSRPNRFRFSYTLPFEQLIVADGRKVWVHDPDLNQVSTRPISQALGATPAALLAGGQLEQEFNLKALPDRDGQSWVEATPKNKESTFTLFRLGFKGRELVAIDILDNFGQRSLLTFSQVKINPNLSAELFKFVPPKGADVVEQ